MRIPASPDTLGSAALATDTRGAVYVEFLVAFMPLFVFFMALVQFGFVQTANLVVKHSAVTGARAASVVLPDDPAFYGGAPLNRAEGKRFEEIERAVKMPLVALEPAPAPKVTFPSTPGGTDSKVSFTPSETVRVRVEYDYRCFVPIGRQLVCGLVSGKKKLLAEAALPNHGASFTY
ncbi:MAG: TadE family protein [Polyangiaceae bacterium]